MAGMSDLSRINTNIQALNALNNLNNINNQLAMHQLRMTTGKKINSPSDNAAGWTIATKLRSRAAGLGQALANISSSKDMIAVGEGHLQNIQSILENMRTKAEEAANDTLGDNERDAILKELQDYNTQINMETNQAQWNGQDLLKGTSTFNFQIGAKTATSDKLSFNIANEVFGGTGTSFNTAGLEVNAQYSGSTVLNQTSTASVITGLTVGTTNYTYDSSEGNFSIQLSNIATAGAGTVTGDISLLKDGTTIATAVGVDLDTPAATVLKASGASISVTAATMGTADVGQTYVGGSFTLQDIHSVSSQSQAQAFMTKIDTAIDNISKALSYTGSITNRLTYQETSLSTAQTRTEAARSTIEDADMAYEQLQATKLMILQQTATAMLVQSNTAPQSILTLFR